MKRETLIYSIASLAVLGLIDSLYLASHAITDTSLFCDIGAGLDGCNQVAQSPYSRPFGVPLAYLGVLFYALLLLASYFAFWKHHRYLHKALLAIAFVGAVFSIVFLYIQFALIKALCIYCIVSAFIAFVSLVAAFWLDTYHAPQTPVIP